MLAWRRWRPRKRSLDASAPRPAKKLRDAEGTQSQTAPDAMLAWRRWKPSVIFLFQRLCSQAKPYKDYIYQFWGCAKESDFYNDVFYYEKCAKAYDYFVTPNANAIAFLLISLGYNCEEDDARCSPAVADAMKKKFDACIKAIDDKFCFPKYDDRRKFEVSDIKYRKYQEAWCEVLRTKNRYRSFELQFLIIALRVKFCTLLMEWRWGEDAVHEFNSNDEEAFFERITEETPCVTIAPGLYDTRTEECLVKRRCAPAPVLTPT